MVREKCGQDYDCLFQNYRFVQSNLEHLSNIPAALYVGEERVKIARQEKSLEDEGQVCIVQYRLYDATGDKRMSIISLDRAERIFEKTDNQRELTLVKMYQLKSSLAYQDIEEVLPQLDALLAQSEARDDTVNTTELHVLLMQELLEAGRYDKVERHIEALENISSNLTGPDKYSIDMRIARGRAGLARSRNDLDEAVRQYKKALQILHKTKDQWLEVNILQLLAKVEWERGFRTVAKTYLDQAEQEASDTNSPKQLARNYEIKSRFAEEEDRTDEALDYLKKKLFYAQKWENQSAGFDMRNFYLQQGKEQLAAEKEKKELELTLKESQLLYSRIIIVLSILLATGLIIDLYKQQKGKRELTEQNSLIQQQSERLKSLDKLKSRFFANVSHELRDKE